MEGAKAPPALLDDPGGHSHDYAQSDPDPSQEHRLTPLYPHTRHLSGSGSGRLEVDVSSHKWSPPGKHALTPHESHHCQVPQTCPEIDAYAIEGWWCASGPLPLVSGLCSPMQPPEQNDDAAQVASGGEEGPVGEPLVWFHPHLPPRTAG